MTSQLTKQLSSSIKYSFTILKFNEHLKSLRNNRFFRSFSIVKLWKQLVIKRMKISSTCLHPYAYRVCKIYLEIFMTVSIGKIWLSRFSACIILKDKRKKLLAQLNKPVIRVNSRPSSQRYLFIKPWIFKMLTNEFNSMISSRYLNSIKKEIQKKT